eukprot:Skav217068  [mRNA]  locus=scaffold208:514018:517086:+ [translate_table: standard]
MNSSARAGIPGSSVAPLADTQEAKAKVIEESSDKMDSLKAIGKRGGDESSANDPQNEDGGQEAIPFTVADLGKLSVDIANLESSIPEEEIEKVTADQDKATKASCDSDSDGARTCPGGGFHEIVAEKGQ